MPDDEALTSTRHALHAVAELVLAGSQYAACARITLKVTPGGFSTRFEPSLAIDGTALVGEFGRIDLDGLTVREVCARAGLELIDLSEVYADGAAYGPDDELRLDPWAVEALAHAWTDGHHALLQVAADSDPILWPEHFDVGVTVGEVNLGVSPGDSFLGVPYAYVGPWSPPPMDEFFNAPFGAARALAELGGPAAIAGFFAEGLDRCRT
jgi:hypothetical protein